MTVPRSPRFYRPELDALRFAAFMLVFFRHSPHPGPSWSATALMSGQAGVCVFFMLSAFLITELLEREVERTGTVNLRAFYVRRVLRIWPLYFLALLLARLIDWHAPHLQMSNGRLVASILLAGNWYTFWHGFPASFALVLWSISVEEQFYLIWPSVRRYLGRVGVITISAITLPTSYLVLFWLGHRHATNTQVWTNTFTQLQYFGLGGLLALVLRGRVPQMHAAVRALLGLWAVTCFVLAQFALRGQEAAEVAAGGAGVATEFLLMLIGTVLLFFAFNGARISASSVWVGLGKISYGLYVFHLLCFRVVLRPFQWLGPGLSVGAETLLYDGLALLLAIGVATLSYRYFESYFLRLKERFEVVRSRAI